MTKNDIKAEVAKRLCGYGIGPDAMAWSTRQAGVLEVLIGGERRSVTAKHGMLPILVDMQIARLEAFARAAANQQAIRRPTP